ncbi:ribbon-helix-helix domain-containing protein [Zavarzinia compransoris]|uniref:Aryl-sulfate sulfotransferase n=1 Tax=Zavarzinia compransoris TaxID=1264899 RepID=A0A317E998_9PROT|nr:ribbon-helix-helix domain-containing protein [Zavarzinia compransoris]PWR23301.1 aryl-sulfate sulfotransferase [Zavarzinia compransoris]TDP46128.1 putative DNA-binding ribbon-helix-helix protein [Zavarzinia compransoris]
MQKRSIEIAGHRTSVSLEDSFWMALADYARLNGQTVNALVTEIDATRDGDTNLSSAIRQFLLAAARAGRLPLPAPAAD